MIEGVISTLKLHYASVWGVSLPTPRFYGNHAGKFPRPQSVQHHAHGSAGARIHQLVAVQLKRSVSSTFSPTPMISSGPNPKPSDCALKETREDETPLRVTTSRILHIEERIESKDASGQLKRCNHNYHSLGP